MIWQCVIIAKEVKIGIKMMKFKINIFAYSDKGCLLAKRISETFFDSDVFSLKKYADKYGVNAVDSVCNKVGEVFNESKALIFVGACGIAVRGIAPYVKSKVTDPAVIVIDDNANFVIPILSGHIGGANEIARLLADKLNSTLVLTTATDINKRFSVDTWAVKHGCHISNMNTAKEISANILISDIALKSDFPINGNLPNGVKLHDNGELGIYITYKTDMTFDKTLHLIPKVLHVGIGCRKGKSYLEINDFFKKIIMENNINIKSIKDISSIDIKKDELGLLEFAKNYKLPINFYSSVELSTLECEFTPSDFVKSVTGVDNVCERAAFKSSNGGEFILRKTSDNGITIAICVEDWSVRFDEI